LKNETNFFPAVPLNLFVKKLKSISQKEFSAITDNYNVDDYSEAFNVEKIIQNSLAVVNNRLNEFYLKKGKISTAEYALYKKTLESICEDFKDGGMNQGLYDYFIQFMPGTSKEVFYKHYHQKLEYLNRVLKKAIADELAE